MPSAKCGGPPVAGPVTTTQRDVTGAPYPELRGWLFGATPSYVLRFRFSAVGDVTRGQAHPLVERRLPIVDDAVGDLLSGVHQPHRGV